MNRDIEGHLLGASGLQGSIYCHHWHGKCSRPRKTFPRHLLGFVVKSGGHREEISDGLAGFAGFLAVWVGSQWVMEMAAAIAGSALGEQASSARHRIAAPSPPQGSCQRWPPERNPGGIAEGKLAIGALESHAPASQAVERGRPDKGIVVAADAGVEVVRHDEEDIGAPAQTPGLAPGESRGHARSAAMPTGIRIDARFMLMGSRLSVRSADMKPKPQNDAIRRLHSVFAIWI